MSNETTIRDLPWARFIAGNNELKLRAKTVAEAGPEAADALMFRFQVPVENLQGSGYLGVIGADIMRDGVERVQMKLGFKLDPGPVLELYATRPGTAGNDGDEVRVFRIALDGVEFGVPLKGIAIGAQERVRRFYTDRDVYVINWQDDTGKPTGTIYRVDPTKPEDQWEAVGEVPIRMF